MSQNILKEYEIPALGWVRIIEDTERDSFERYYAKPQMCEETSGRGTLEDAEKIMFVEMTFYLQREKERSEEYIRKIKKGLEEIAKRNTSENKSGEVN